MTLAFSTAHIGLTAAIAAVLVAVLGRIIRVPLRDVAAAALLTFGGVLGWRLAANVAAINDDGMPWVSANDVLAPLVVYVLLGMFADLAEVPDRRRYERFRVGATALALVVDVIAI